MEQCITTEKWVCGKCEHEIFEKPAHRNVVCESCHKGRYQTWRLCECGRWFHPENMKQRTCSKECGYKVRETGKKGKHYPHLQKARIATCEVCGKEFRAVKEWHGHLAKYCSKECWGKRATIMRNCAYCGREIKTYASANKKYCSNKCRDMDYRKRTGEQATAWKGGKTEESILRRRSAAYREWRSEVFSRDGYKCTICGAKGEIEAHHIKEVCNFPDLICEISNGQTLCHECHKKTDNYANKAKRGCTA